MPNVIANPLTGPDPNTSKITAAMSVVIFASIIALKARS